MMLFEQIKFLFYQQNYFTICTFYSKEGRVKTKWALTELKNFWIFL